MKPFLKKVSRKFRTKTGLLITHNYIFKPTGKLDKIIIKVV